MHSINSHIDSFCTFAAQCKFHQSTKLYFANLYVLSKMAKLLSTSCTLWVCSEATFQCGRWHVIKVVEVHGSTALAACCVTLLLQSSIA